MPNDAVRDQLINLAGIVKEVRELRALADAKEEEFKLAFTDFFLKNREYVFSHASSDDGEEAPFRYHDLPKERKYSIWDTPPMGRGVISCSCGSRIDSCDECGDGHYSYFTVTEDAQILRVRMDK